MKRLAREQFNRQAQYYSVSRSHAEGDSLQVLLDLASLHGNEEALDVATGAGFTACGVAARAAGVIALDVAPAMLQETAKLAQGRSLANVAIVLGAAEDLPFVDDSFDLVTCRIAAHHFEDLSAAVDGMARVVRPGGAVLLADTAAPEDAEAEKWMNEVEASRDPSHVRNLRPSEWMEELQRAGLHVTYWAMTLTHFEFRDWACRSATPLDTARQLEARFLEAPEAVRRAFRIRTVEGKIWFSWDCPVFRAEKRQP